MKFVFAVVALVTLLPVSVPAAGTPTSGSPQVKSSNKKPRKVKVHTGKKHRKP